MEETIKYIETKLDVIVNLNILEKFDFLLSSSYALSTKGLNNNDSLITLIKQLLTKIEALRYEMAYNKAIETVSYRLDKVLAYEALKLSRIISKGKELIKYINDVLYYEINEGVKEELKNELNQIKNSKV